MLTLFSRIFCLVSSFRCILLEIDKILEEMTQLRGDLTELTQTYKRSPISLPSFADDVNVLLMALSELFFASTYKKKPHTHVHLSHFQKFYDSSLFCLTCGSLFFTAIPLFSYTFFLHFIVVSLDAQVYRCCHVSSCIFKIFLFFLFLLSEFFCSVRNKKQRNVVRIKETKGHSCLIFS